MDPKGKKALAEAAKAFERAKRKGYVWVREDGAWESHESRLMFIPPAPPNPDQLRFGG